VADKPSEQEDVNKEIYLQSVSNLQASTKNPRFNDHERTFASNNSIDQE
jgi:hypothetical protein